MSAQITRAKNPMTEEEKQELIAKINSRKRDKDKYGDAKHTMTEDLILKNQQLNERVLELEEQLNKVTTHNITLQKGKMWFKRFFTKTFEWVR